MPLRPPIARRRSPPQSVGAAPVYDGAQTPSPPNDGLEQRLTRPQLERSGPQRSSDGFLRGEKAGVATGPTQTTAAPFTPAQQGVAEAYQVFDRYLEEGRRYAQGQSAWNSNGQSGPSLTSALRGGGDVAAFLIRFIQDLSQATRSVNEAWTGRLDDARNALSPRPFHPQMNPDYPARSANVFPIGPISAWTSSTTKPDGNPMAADPAEDDGFWERVNLAESGAAPSQRPVLEPPGAAPSSFANTMAVPVRSPGGPLIKKTPRGGHESVPAEPHLPKTRWAGPRKAKPHST